MNWAFDADVQRWDAYGRDAQIGRLYPTHEKTISNSCCYKLIKIGYTIGIRISDDNFLLMINSRKVFMHKAIMNNDIETPEIII